MCIAIYKPKDKIISKETLQECFRRNSDGAGFTYISDKGIKIHKGYFTFDAFYKAYQKLETNQMLIHFRIKTHGKVAVENCHPFFVRHDLAFIHNGIISQHSGNALQSDTREFNDKILKPLVQEFGTTIIQSPAFKALAEDYIAYSKLVFLDVSGNYTIINENKGIWDDGIWYSNGSYKAYEYKPTAITPYKPAYKRPETTYYLNRENNNRIDEGDFVLTNATTFGIPAGTVVEVMFISSEGKVDIKLPNGCLVQNIRGAYLSIYSPQLSAFRDITTNDDLLY